MRSAHLARLVSLSEDQRLNDCLATCRDEGRKSRDYNSAEEQLWKRGQERRDGILLLNNVELIFVCLANSLRLCVTQEIANLFSINDYGLLS